MRLGAAMVLVMAGCGAPDASDPGDGQRGTGGVDRGLDVGPDAAPPIDALVLVDAPVLPADAAIDPCADGVRDGSETDVDCGGPACGACALGRACAISSDCANANCVAETCAALAAVSFSAPVTYFSGFKPYFVRAGDLDGDGDVDLVVGNEQASAVAVFRNLGVSSGMFQRVAEHPTGAYPTGAELADLDRDGIADVVTADYRGDSVSVLLGRGEGAGYTLTAAVSYPTVVDGETSNLAVGDLDGDGLLDVVACNPQRASASVFLGRADGTLAAAPPIDLGATAEPYSVAIGDFDGDGTNDVALADDRSGTVDVRLGDGDGTFAPAPLRPLIGGTRSHIMLARDMDGDGRLDLVIASRSSSTVSVLLGRGDGTFRPAAVTSTGAGTGPYSLAVADFDLDGIPDVATANYVSSTASVLLGRGDGTFAVISTGVVGGTSYGIAAGDFDGDGRPDLAIANAVSNTLAIVRNTSN